MKKVLVTGMTAQQSSARLSHRAVTFSGEIVRSLEDAGYVVEQMYPSVEMTSKTLKEYDLILVGVSPILSLSCNFAYGALSVISEMKDTSKIMYIVDSPEPEKIQISLKSVLRNPSSLFKDFYKSRSEFSSVVNNKKMQQKLLSTVEYLAYSWGKKTIYPSTPFINDFDVNQAVFDGNFNFFRGVSVDRRLISTNMLEILMPKLRVNVWSCTDLKSKWAQSLEKTLKYDVVALKKSKADTDATVQSTIATSLGLIAPPQANGMLWWSYPVIQAINTGTPVVTDWRIGAQVSGSWTYLASFIEDCKSVYELIDIARSQRDGYLGSIDSVKEAIDRLVSEVESPI